MYDWKDNRINTNLSHLKINPIKRVAITFDDGPTEHSKAIIEILKSQNVPATFFWISSQIKDTELTCDILKSGCTIGLHGHRHLPFHQLSPAVQEREITKGLKQLQNHLMDACENSETPNVKYFRPPYGRYNDTTLEILKDKGLKPILWNVASLDWELEDDPGMIIENVTNHIQDGSIILMHDLPQTVKVLEELIIQIKKLGYEFSAL